MFFFLLLLQLSFIKVFLMQSTCNFRLQIISSRLSTILVTLMKTCKLNRWLNSYFITPNFKLHVQFHLMKLSCGKAKVDLSSNKKFNINSETSGINSKPMALALVDVFYDANECVGKKIS